MSYTRLFRSGNSVRSRGNRRNSCNSRSSRLAWARAFWRASISACARARSDDHPASAKPATTRIASPAAIATIRRRRPACGEVRGESVDQDMGGLLHKSLPTYAEKRTNLAVTQIPPSITPIYHKQFKVRKREREGKRGYVRG